MSSKKSGQTDDSTQEDLETTERSQPSAPRKTAMRLPEGAFRKPSSGPAFRKGKGTAPDGRAQKDAARRLGKDRKVH